jgi:hypothetical protein
MNGREEPRAQILTRLELRAAIESAIERVLDGAVGKVAVADRRACIVAQTRNVFVQLVAGGRSSPTPTAARSSITWEITR